MDLKRVKLSQWAREALDGDVLWLEVPEGTTTQDVASRVKATQRHIGRQLATSAYTAVPPSPGCHAPEAVRLMKVTAHGPTPPPKKKPGRKKK